MKTCARPDCESPRWYGPNGTNLKLTMCEHHQREYWREKKAERYVNADLRREAAVRPPPQKRGRKPKAASSAEQVAPVPSPLFAPPKPKTSLARRSVKVLLLDYNTREMIHIEGEVVLNTPLPDDPLCAELLLEGYEDYLVAQRGDEPQVGIMSAYEGR